jgi:hypothetical protein
MAAGTDLKSIVGVAEYLKLVVDAVHELDSNVRLRAVTRIAHVRFLAVAIVLRKFPAETEGFLLSLWEKVSFRVFGLHGADTRHKVGDYVRLGFEIIAGSSKSDAISQSIKRLGEGYSIDNALKVVNWAESYEGWTEELRYLLFRYDEFLARKAGEVLNATQWNKIWGTDPSKSIEHIQPQSSELRYIHHVGNLTMLPPGINSSLRDKPPKDKAASYKSCGLRATALVGRAIEKGGWGEKDVKKRAAEIEEFVRLEWAD